MKEERVRFSITLSAELYERVEHYQHANKYKTQTKAVADLVQRGLDSLTQISSDNSDPAIIDGEAQLMSIRFSQLNSADKMAVYRFAGYLLDSETDISHVRTEKKPLTIAARGGKVMDASEVDSDALEVALKGIDPINSL